MGYVMMGNERKGADRMDAPDLMVAALSDAVGRLLRAGCLPFVLSFGGPFGRHNRMITEHSYLEMVVSDPGPVIAADATVNALVETTLSTGVLVFDVAELDELDLDLMRSKDR